MAVTYTYGSSVILYRGDITYNGADIDTTSTLQAQLIVRRVDVLPLIIGLVVRQNASFNLTDRVTVLRKNSVDLIDRVTTLRKSLIDLEAELVVRRFDNKNIVGSITVLRQSYNDLAARVVTLLEDNKQLIDRVEVLRKGSSNVNSQVDVLREATNDLISRVSILKNAVSILQDRVTVRRISRLQLDGDVEVRKIVRGSLPCYLDIIKSPNYKRLKCQLWVEYIYPSPLPLRCRVTTLKELILGLTSRLTVRHVDRSNIKGRLAVIAKRRTMFYMSVSVRRYTSTKFTCRSTTLLKSLVNIQARCTTLRKSSITLTSRVETLTYKSKQLYGTVTIWKNGFTGLTCRVVRTKGYQTYIGLFSRVYDNLTLISTC